MIFENNYAYAGRTAIIYNFELDYPELGFYLYKGLMPQVQPNTGVTEIGIKYKKSEDNYWNIIRLSDSEKNGAIQNGSLTINGLFYTDPNPERSSMRVVTGENKNYYFYIDANQDKHNRMIPIRVIIRNLTQNTEYDICSYYIKNGINYTFNNCNMTTTQVPQDQEINFSCERVTGDGTEQQKESLKSLINQACEIFNDITSFSTKDNLSTSDFLGIGAGGKFSAKIDSSMNGNVGGGSDMSFPSTINSLSTVCHEMAHNLMNQTNIEQDILPEYQELVRNKMIKFMEFATHAEGAEWKWLGAHNYPVISSEQYNIVQNYLVAAACQVSHDMTKI